MAEESYITKVKNLVDSADKISRNPYLKPATKMETVELIFANVSRILEVGF